MSHQLISGVFHLGWGCLSYELFKVVNRRVALFALVIMIGMTVGQIVTAIVYLGPRFILTSSGSVFTPQQAQPLAYASLRFSSYTFNAQLFLFGLWCVLLAGLILRSRFLPRVLGILLCIAGCGWMFFLVPPLGFRWFPYIAAASAIGEIPLELWLMVMAVNSQRWEEQAKTSAQCHDWR
jgi:Domain of unknown function (DUF4386)